jgi:hypothetical protein
MGRLLPNKKIMAAALLACGLWYSWTLTAPLIGLDFYPAWGLGQWAHSQQEEHVRGLRAQARFGQYSWNLSVRGRPGTREAAAAAANLNLYGGRIETPSTPFLYAFVGAFVSGQYDRDYYFFSLVGILSFVGAAFAFGRAVGFGIASALVACACLTLPFAPFWSLLVTANIGAIQGAFLLASLTLFIDSRGSLKSVAGGVLFSIAVLLKPTIGPAALALGLVWLVDRNWGLAVRISVGAVAGALAALAAGSLFLGTSSAWGEWFLDTVAMLRSTRPFDPWNCSWVTQVRAVLGVDISIIVLMALLAATAAAVWQGRIRHPEDAPQLLLARRTALAGAVGCGVAILAGPYNWLHNYLAAAPLVLWHFRPGAWEARTRSARGTLLLSIALLFTGVHRSGLPSWVVETIFANVALALLVGLGLIDLAARDTGRPPNPDSHSVI